MKVLLIGSDEYIATSLIKRFRIDHDQILLVGNFRQTISSRFDNISFYFSDENYLNKIDEIIITHIPETIIYFENFSSSKQNFTLDEINKKNEIFYSVFSTLTKSKVSKFIYISCAKMLERDKMINPNVELDFELTPHIIAETFIDSLRLINSMETTILRVTDLYGRNVDDLRNPINYYLRKKTNGNIGDKDELWSLDYKADYIYESDFAQAVFRACHLPIYGIFTIASGRLLSVSNIMEIVDNLENPEFSGTELPNSIYDIKKTSVMLDFIGKVNELDGIKYSHDRISRNNREVKQTRKEFNIPRMIREFFKGVFAPKEIDLLKTIENIVLFLIVAKLVLQNDITLIMNFIDIRMFYIVLIGSIYGLKQSIISTILCVLLLGYQYYQQEVGFLYFIYDEYVISSIFMYLLSGVLIGYFVNSKVNLVLELKSKVERYEDKYKFMKDMYEESIEVKNTLQAQIFKSKDSYGRIFRFLSKLNSLEVEELKHEIITSTESILENNYISLYMVSKDSNFMRLISSSKSIKNLPKSIHIDDYPSIKKLLLNQEIFVLENISSDFFIKMAAPIINNNETIAMLAMHELRFEDNSLGYKNMFDVTARIVNQSIVRALEYQKLSDEEEFIEEYDVLKSEYLKEKKEQLLISKNEGVSDFTTIIVENYITIDLCHIVRSQIREFDFIGINKDDNVEILLTNTKRNEAIYFLNRLTKKGIDAKIEGDL